jgi:predicted nucleic acid-binding protein
MTSSSEPLVERGLDAMLIVYSLLKNHPASTVCEQFIRTHTGWLTTTLTLLEAKAILVKVYAVDAVMASQKLAQFAAGPIVIVPVDLSAILAAMNVADSLRIDLTDAVLLHLAQAYGASRLATDDVPLARACQQMGILHETPIDSTLRRQMAQWESAYLPAKGLPRILWQIYHWLSQSYPEVAQAFWSRTGGGTHLP